MSKGAPPSSIATYIRRDECIRISNHHDDHDHAAPSSLAASIVGISISNEQLSFGPPRNNSQANFNYLIGEIEEIKILDGDMNTVALHRKSSHPRYSQHQKSSKEQKRAELLRKRLDLEQRQSRQVDDLTRRQSEETRAIENHPNFSEEEMEYVLANVTGPLHETQSRMMQERHRREQQDLMDLLFHSVLGDEAASLKAEGTIYDRRENTPSRDDTAATATAAAITQMASAPTSTMEESNSMTSSKRSIPESTATESDSSSEDDSSTETSTKVSTTSASYSESLIVTEL